MSRSFVVTASLFALAAGPCAAKAPDAPAKAGVPAQEHSVSAQPVADLPFARGKTFPTLDAYLAHLEALGAYDIPWYREVEPGVYERVSGRRPRGQPPARFTRRELVEKYGFRE
ncbi:hypothetical protein [Caulobacter sp. 17J80-11]|uniref:hypothetical protein n=1 Tax=Caulobacter sp. 17J80-11 TaxID=2763502 RepID=UPI00165342B0|nr:hypothetical protein [Caulobacter sp. 17J80-11]MBC6981707.1 hypothetical protein [Caulobacter sp. 17J80-11]